MGARTKLTATRVNRRYARAHDKWYDKTWYRDDCTRTTNTLYVYYCLLKAAPGTDNEDAIEKSSVIYRDDTTPSRTLVAKRNAVVAA